MTSDGSPYTRFKRALDAGNLLQARAAAAELPRVNLGDALSVVWLMREDETLYGGLRPRALDGRGVSGNPATRRKLIAGSRCRSFGLKPTCETRACRVVLPAAGASHRPLPTAAAREVWATLDAERGDDERDPPLGDPFSFSK